MARDPLAPWSGFPDARQDSRRLWWATDALPKVDGTLLPRGLGRSYGDVCLNDGGTLLLTDGLSRFLSFDRTAGLVRAEAGVTLGQILQLVTPSGWFLPVLPGTQFVTLGGAIANDVHGKNHHRAGTFGDHVTQLELLRSDGRRVVCSKENEPELFRATIAGLGLTGLITWAEVRLAPIQSTLVRSTARRFRGIDEFASLSAAEERHEYVVAWVDALAKEPSGVLFSGDHEPASLRVSRRPRLRLSVPIECPSWLLSRLTVRTFNALYTARFKAGSGDRVTHYEPFFFPLDAIGNWNRLYGRRGPLQWQAILPGAAGVAAAATALRLVARSGTASFLTVMKTMGNSPPAGLLSFSRQGITVAFDFPHRGDATFRLMARLDRVAMDAGGAVYPAKAAQISPEVFRASFPRWREFSRFIDPAFSSSLWRRVSAA